MHRRYGLTGIALVLLAVLLTACGGSKATNTPESPTTAPTVAAGSASAATSPAVTTGSSAAGSATRPTGSATSATTGTSATASTVAVGSSVIGTRPAGSVTVGGTTAASSSAAGGTLTVFTDPKGRFTFSRPAAWTVGQPSAQSVVQFNSTNPLGVIDVSTEPAPPGITIDTLLTLAITEVKKTIPDAQQIGTLPLQVGGEQAMQIDYTGTVSGNKIYFSQIYTIHSGTVYILTLGAQTTDIDRMKQQAIVVVQTWKFLQ